MHIPNWLESFRRTLESNNTRRKYLKRHRIEQKQLAAPVEQLEERLMLTIDTIDLSPDPADTSSPATSNVSPTQIEHALLLNQSVTDTVILDRTTTGPGDEELLVPSADVVFVVDESGSMGGEHAWISQMVSELESALEVQGINDNRFALVGYLGEGNLFNMAPSDVKVTIYDETGTQVDQAIINKEYNDNSSGNSAFVRAEFNLPADGTYYAVVETDELDQQGLISLEAENFKTSTAGAGGDTWSEVDNFSASGGKQVKSGPDNGTFYGSSSVGSAPRLDYDINFTETGTYHVWLRGQRPDNQGEDVHIGLDGQQYLTQSDFNIW